MCVCVFSGVFNIHPFHLFLFAEILQILHDIDNCNHFMAVVWKTGLKKKDVCRSITPVMTADDGSSALRGFRRPLVQFHNWKMVGETNDNVN